MITTRKYNFCDTYTEHLILAQADLPHYQKVKSKSNCNKGMGKCAGGAIRCPKNGVWEGLFEVERVAYGRKRIQKGWFGVLARV